MNAIKQITLLILGLGASLLTAPCLAGEVDNTVRIAGDEEKRGGYLVEITEAAFTRAGYKPEFNFVPWARALTGTIQGTYQVLLAAYYSDERAKSMSYSEPIGSVEVYFWAKKDSGLRYEKLEDMKPYLIGFIRGSTISPEFDLAMKSYLRIDLTNDPELNLKHLLIGRIDTFVEKKQQVEYLLATKYPQEIGKVVTVGPPLKVGKFYNTISHAIPNYQRLLEDFNRGLKMIREDGTEKAILAKHGLK